MNYNTAFISFFFIVYFNFIALMGICSAERIQLCNICRGHYGSGGHFVQNSRTICLILVEAIIEKKFQMRKCWLSFVVSFVSLSLSHWYPGSGVVLDCIDS